MRGAESRGGLGGADPAAAPGPEVRCGPAGWSYDDWNGIVDDGSTGTRLDLLVSLFPTIEVNATFYRDVPPRQVAAWCRRVETRPDFRWCFKLHRRLSHAGGPPTPPDLLTACAAFGPAREAGRLGALLLQFPWSLRPDPAARTALSVLATVAREAGWPLVIEVRHAGWAGPVPFATVVPDQPALRGNLGPDEALAAALPHAGPGAPLYIRLHGRNASAWFDPQAGRDARYDYLYDEGELAQWQRRLRAAARSLPPGAPVYAIANNHFRGQAVVNALQLQRLWTGAAPPLPAALRRAYPRELAAFPEAAPPRPAPRRRRPRPAGGGEPTLF